jgi:two-component system, OmpR family, phosphate regulon sensor histidine kinase PhoR
MKEQKYRFIIPLMIISMLLLTVLQVLWLRSEYRSAVNAFNRETNLLFRSTIHHLTDSLIYSRFKIIADVDTLSNPSHQTRMINITVNDTLFDGNPSLFTEDSIRRPSDMRFLFHSYADVLNADLLERQYSKTLANNARHISFIILTKELNRGSGTERMRFESSDTIPFTTSFIPLGRTAYAASFDNVNALLIKKLLPQIGFSTFITLIILLSFIQVYKGLRSQQRLIEQKNDFIGNMTHELKTPVATVGVALEAMRSFDVLKDANKAHQYLDMATHELNRLGMMTDKILRTSIYDYAAEIKSNKSPVSLTIIIEEVISSFALLAERKHMSLIFEHDSDVIINGNEEHLTQMLYNLIDNAVKYASSGPEIIVRLSVNGDCILIWVIDRGEGIPDIHQKRIFEKFYRVPSGNVHTVKGYGLGLHYVKGVVESHGGKVILESQPGQGCTFLIKLPKNG